MRCLVSRASRMHVKLQLRLIERSRKIVPRRALFASVPEVCCHEMPQVAVTFRGLRATYAKRRTIPSFCIRLRNVLGRRFNNFAAPRSPSIRQFACVSASTMC